MGIVEQDSSRCDSALYYNFPKPVTKRIQPVQSELQTVKLLENGALNLEETPQYLIELVERNAVQSPLLRIPAEIRNRIFTFAMGGLDVQVRFIWTRVDGNYTRRKLKGRAVDWQNNNQDAVYVQPAFHFIEVSRQIYAEFATLAYSANAFDFYFQTMNAFLDVLNDAQIAAIKTIEIDGAFFDYHRSDYFDEPGREQSRPTVSSYKKKFPGLKKVIVSEDMVDDLYSQIPQCWKKFDQVLGRRNVPTKSFVH
ncbi:hypothetical protein BDV96DRAFT_390469 [Lophiotrema nucula]|uniref:DUF7730 domain-containing protein n=1 Tax=Lophiotrema nucula TaxID=690887 RepID=A0A6A5ZHK3_9PLEO|nr:hypothetical protein BDV96DRAFT_390469 [Lophiotrema nucula]